ncbi:uncharacterized protein LOC124261795 isoform X9 [Haliotis rubra]|uniref:uncharacterized protein LOC124261795 isoform X9 n=1 Tax=Haliotis rubra TaxID=36100 RepID=UPI001EE5A4ED|nr:uncharacterized protein LOC124261795 isoform X9 [Haliotis rubra]
MRDSFLRCLGSAKPKGARKLRRTDSDYYHPPPEPAPQAPPRPQQQEQPPRQPRRKVQPQPRPDPRSQPHIRNKPMKGILKNPLGTNGYYGYQPIRFEEPDRKREQFMAVLAQRYPQYADRISGSQYSGSGSESGFPIQQQPRQRDHQRRRTTIVTYNPDHNRSMEYDSGTMSDVDLPPSSFQRGGFTRSSLPIVRSSSSTFDRPLGLVFLIFRDETKKALLPNEITSLDTVRALFVRSFPEKLSMEFLDSPKRKIYVLEPKSNIYFQLEDLRDIKDRSLLKIHECESIEPQRVKEYPPALRGRSVQSKNQQAPPKPARDHDAVIREEYAKTRSLPAQLTNHYQEIIDDQRMWEVERRSRSHTPEVDRPRSLSVGPARTRASPERLPTPERVMLRTIPEHQQMRNGYPPSVNGGSNGNYETLPAYQRDLRSQAASPTGPPPHRPFSPPGTSSHYEPVYGYHQQPGAPQPPQTYVAHSVRAHTVHAPQRATVPPVELRNGTRNNNQNRHSLTFAPMSGGQGQGQVPNQEPPYQRSQSYRVTPERDTVAQRARKPHPPTVRLRHQVQRANVLIKIQTPYRQDGSSAGQLDCMGAQYRQGRQQV